MELSIPEGRKLKDQISIRQLSPPKYGTYEYVVLPFGLAGAPSIYQRFVASILDPIKRPWLQVYIDDVLIFSQSPEEHLEHVDEVLSILTC